MIAKDRALGFGLGLRHVYYPEILESPQPVDWFEIISENYMVPGGRPLATLDRIRADYPMRMHGVSLSLASADPLDFDYLRALKRLIERVEPELVSDHLAWTGVHGLNLHDLLPAPLTRESLDHCVERASRVQDFLGRRIALENPSTYVAFAADEMSEADFLAELARRADCLLLLDVNNVYVSAFNHGFRARDYFDKLPKERVAQIHVAGHSDAGTHKIDTHDHPVCDDVWALFSYVRERFGPVPAMIERDDLFPPFAELLDELRHMRALAEAGERAAA
ncbi:DUF692 domain-containing protein [Rhodoblastus acidophilus]|uniref:UPF0276 protein K2U94_16690 n=1 Tax=Candidatus Rhodoblastus alkanivorans TaxID=2954117 RepID=A0ABS9Z9R7_9HYPH|nr:DUF692 domain-containing protein [Candidatus Rhodoblastus alkanivorans]MCI4680822.1 DUF692 domain-containing protein [Candidatus Rhodoblastus alkanivorans]MCI4684379.1 DUF692 domain-containing protein [Candidatus Rhodoblastus alkanivorans]MDI4641700.1 DUF692 domain-containing protein [Rhodoblastus acidophilus]